MSSSLPEVNIQVHDTNIAASSSLDEPLLAPPTTTAAARAPCCTRRRKLCAGGTLMTLVACVVLALFVGNPMLIRSVLDASKLEFTDVHITAPTDSSVFMAATAVIHARALPVKATIAPTTATVYYKGQEIGLIHMPRTDVQGKTIVSVASPLVITHKENWAQFTHGMIFEKHFDWEIKASLAITVFGTTYRDIPFDKLLRMKGMDGMRNLRMDVFDLSHSTPGAIIVDVTTTIPNPSVFSMDPLGNLTFDMMYKGSVLGVVHSLGSKLERGHSKVRMIGKMEPSNKTISAEMMNLYLTNQDAPVQAVVHEPTCNSVPLYNDGMKGLALDVTIKGGGVDIIKSIDFSSLALTPRGQDVVDLEATCVAVMSNPLGDASPMFVKSMGMDVDLMYDGEVIGHLTTQVTEVNSANTTVTVPVVGSVKLAGDGTAFSRYVTAFLNSDAHNPVTVAFSGTARVAATIASQGDLLVPAYPVKNKSVTMSGMGGLRDVTINSFDLPRNCDDAALGCFWDSAYHGVEIDISTTIVNPSAASVRMGTVTFEMAYDGLSIGNAVAADLALVPGANVVNMKGYIYPPQDDADRKQASQFFSNYLRGIDQVVTVAGVGAEPTVPWVDASLRSMRVSAPFPGAKDKHTGKPNLALIKSVAADEIGMAFAPDGSITTSAKLSIAFKMPWAFPISVTHVALRAGLAASKGAPIFATMQAPMLPVHHDVAAGIIHATLDTVDVTTTDEAAFAAFLSSALITTGTSFYLDGISSPVATTAMGTMGLEDLPATATVAVVGLNSLSGNMEVLSLDVVDAWGVGYGKATLVVGTTIRVTNPSNMYASLGKIAMRMIYNGVDIGVSSLDNLDLKPGRAAQVFVARTTMVMTEANADAQRAFLGRYCSSIPSTVALHGAQGAEGSPLALLQPAIQALDTSVTVPAAAKTVTGISLDMSASGIWSALAKQKISATVTLVNTVSSHVSLHILQTDIRVTTHQGTHVGDWRYAGEPIVLQPGLPRTIPILVDLSLPSNGKEAYDTLRTISDAVSGHSTASCKGLLVGAFVGTDPSRGMYTSRLADFEAVDVPMTTRT